MPDTIEYDFSKCWLCSERNVLMGEFSFTNTSFNVGSGFGCYFGI